MVNGIPRELWLLVVLLINLGWLTAIVYIAVRYFRRNRNGGSGRGRDREGP